MSTARAYQRTATARDKRFFADPSLWPHHPFLPLVRRPVGEPEPECGLLFDARGTLGLCGFSATVWRCNYFELPATLDEFLSLPRCAYDTVEELAAGGWTVD